MLAGVDPAFSAFVEMIVWLFFFTLLIRGITMIAFLMENQPCLLDRPHLSLPHVPPSVPVTGHTLLPVR